MITLVCVYLYVKVVTSTNEPTENYLLSLTEL